MKKQSVCGNFETEFAVTFAVIQPSSRWFKAMLLEVQGTALYFSSSSSVGNKPHGYMTMFAIILLFYDGVMLAVSQR